MRYDFQLSLQRGCRPDSLEFVYASNTRALFPTMKLPTLAAIFAFTFMYHQAFADFHLLTGRFVAGSKPNVRVTADVMSFAHTKEYNCHELEGFHRISKNAITEFTTATFKSPTPICGVQDIVFHDGKDGNLTLTNFVGAAGVCHPIQFGPEFISCLAFDDLIAEPNHYICLSHACTGMSIASVTHQGSLVLRYRQVLLQGSG